MVLLIVILVVGSILAYRAGVREQAHRQAKADAADSKTKFYRTWTAEWAAAAASLMSWLMILTCLLLAVGVAASFR